ncbi:histidinol-phosphate transaminase [Peptococcaceae bacterium 1198_IL3148]
MSRVKFNPELLMREDLRTLKPYQPHDYPGTIKLDANENPYPFPQEALAEISAQLKQLAFPRYPDPMAEALRQDIASYVGVQPEQVLMGNGSDELIFNLAMAFGSGGKVVIAGPTFSMYRIHSRIAGAEPVEVPRQQDFSINPNVIDMAVKATSARLVMLCSPNNPTGNGTSLQVLEEVLANTNGVVVVDQAYIEFGGEDCVPLLAKYPNLVILRTFSKAFGLAGLRIGYLLADETVVNALLRIKQPYNLNSFSQVAGGVALKYLPHFKDQWQKIIADRDQMITSLSQLPSLKVYPTNANFMLVHTDMDANVLHRKLLEKNILVRNLGRSLPNHLRISVGTTEENEQLLQATKAIITNGVN